MEIRYNGRLEESLSKLKSRDYLRFNCKRCGKEVVKQKRVIKLEEDLYCKWCKMKISTLNRYGVENVFERDDIQKKARENRKNNGPNKGRVRPEEETKKSKKTKKERYGDENYNNVEKAKETNINKYGVDNPSKNIEVKKKIKESHKRKYGDYYTRTEKYKNNRTKYDNFYNDKILQIKDITPLFEQNEYEGVKKEYKWKCEVCGNIFYSNLDKGKIPICRKCNPIEKGTSLLEKEIIEYLKNLGEEVKEKDRSILNPYEIDVLIPNKNIGIEFDGLYWHSQQILNETNRDGKNHHINKTLKSKEKGIRLVHIFEDEWNFKKGIVKDRLKSLLGRNEYRIGGREIDEIREIDSKTKNNFLNSYHIQGEDKSSIKLGAFKDGSLISIMTFAKPRISLGQKRRKDDYWELSRFVSIPNTYTPGVASKLFKFFIREYNPIYIYTYSDIRWNTGELYKQLGMEYVHRTNPNYWYIEKDGTRNHRFKYRKQELKNKLNYFNESLTEYENMLYNGYDRVWDCGNDKWGWRRE